MHTIYVHIYKHTCKGYVKKNGQMSKRKTEGQIEIKGGFTLGNQNEIHVRCFFDVRGGR